MGQTRNNNLSPLPFYEGTDEQANRLPWAFGDIFPLRCDNRLLPFFFVRDAQYTQGAGDELSADDFDIGYLTADGEWYGGAGMKYYVARYDGVQIYLTDVGARQKALYVKNLPYPPSVEGKNTVNVLCLDSSGKMLEAKTYGAEGSYYTGFIFCPDDTESLLLQRYDGSVDATLHKVATIPRPIAAGTLIDRDGNETSIDFGESIHITDIENSRQLVYFNADTAVLSGVDYGTYFLRLVVGSRQYALFSEWFTYTAVPSVRIEWNDVANLALGEGYIPYAEGYVNRVWLNTSVGFPDYETDKEGDERDGYFFMEKGISRKVYRVRFFAPEYLCDVLRLVPVSDVVTMWDSSRGAEVEYDADDVDMEVEWQEQGNYAAVTLTFKTDTVIKALGKII